MLTLTLALLLLVSPLGDQAIHPVAAVMPEVTRTAVQVHAGRGEAADLFAIYLVAERVDPRVAAYGKGDWSQLPLSDSPLISGDDIIAYDFSKHSMKLRPEALARIPRPSLHGTPFLVVAHGQRIYLGAFVTVISSFSCAVPSIIVDRQLLDPTQPKDTIVIDRAYPSPSFGVGRDPRGDDRIKTALIALHKLPGEG